MRVMMQKKIMCVYSVETEREIVGGERERDGERGIHLRLVHFLHFFAVSIIIFKKITLSYARHMCIYFVLQF